MAKIKKQFPNIYRSFTERFTNFRKNNLKLLKEIKLQSIVSLYVLTIALVLLLSVDLLNSLQNQKEINFEKAKIESEIKLWEGISKKYQAYKDAYFQLAALEYKIGDFQKAKYYINKALYLDPNFEKARNLQNILRNY